MPSPELQDALKIVGGIFWTLTYLLIIRRGFLDRTYGMPFAALCANIAWECIFSFLHPATSPQIYINVVWFVFDIVIVAEFLCYGRPLLDGTLLARFFYPVFVLGLLTAFFAIQTLSAQFHDEDGKIAAFSQNLMMSILFITMLIRRNGLEGQSLYIAFFKMVGTLLFSILYALLYPDAVFLHFLYVSIAIFDLFYVALVVVKAREMGINPLCRI
jgi:hypothetical protein